MTWQRSTRQQTVRENVEHALKARSRARRYAVQGAIYLFIGSALVVYFTLDAFATFNFSWLIVSAMGGVYIWLGWFYLKVIRRRALESYDLRMDSARNMARMWKSIDTLDALFGGDVATSLEAAFKAIEEGSE